MVTSVEIDFADAIRGGEVSLHLSTPARCEPCLGRGTEGGRPKSRCPDCAGAGRRRVAEGPLNVLATCQRCGGSGEIIRTPCSSCQGTGRVSQARRLKVRIPPGVEQGGRIRLAGQGEPGPAGTPSGDLYLEVHVRPHPFFTRRGDDLHIELPVTVSEAYNGARIEVPTPDGPVVLKIPPRSQGGQQFRLRGKGVPARGHQGDLYVQLAVRVPDAEAVDTARLARELDRAYSRNVRAEVKL
jgi:molecular chaperone DnaJ